MSKDRLYCDHPHDPARRATQTVIFRAAEALATLEKNHEEASERGAFGVPTFIVGDQIFWGQDRIDFVAEHLDELRGGAAA